MIGMVNCQNEQEICRKHLVYGYPTLFTFIEGKQTYRLASKYENILMPNPTTPPHQSPPPYPSLPPKSQPLHPSIHPTEPLHHIRLLHPSIHYTTHSQPLWPSYLIHPSVPTTDCPLLRYRVEKTLNTMIS